MLFLLGFEPDITSYLSAFSVFLSVGEFWDSFWAARPRFRTFGRPYSQVGATMSVFLIFVYSVLSNMNHPISELCNQWTYMALTSINHFLVILPQKVVMNHFCTLKMAS